MQAVKPNETEPEEVGRYGGGDFLVLYDGICGLCNRTVQFLLKRDIRDKFRFAPLQGDLAHELLARHGFDADDLDTFYLVLSPGRANESVLKKGRGIVRALKELGGFWSVVAWIGVLPESILNWGYDRIARNRYRWFGKLDACPLPPAAVRRKFLDV